MEKHKLIEKLAHYMVLCELKERCLLFIHVCNCTAHRKSLQRLTMHKVVKTKQAKKNNCNTIDYGPVFKSLSNEFLQKHCDRKLYYRIVQLTNFSPNKWKDFIFPSSL